MITIFVDGREYQVKAGANLLEACLGAGLDLPYFCWHPAMGSIGSCRQCAAIQYQDENDDRGRMVMGCMTAVADGGRYSIAADKADTFRKGVIEALMLDHPHDCPVCGEGGECHLQDMTVMVGHRDRRFEGRKNTYRNQYLGPLIQHEMNRCIACYRCVRFYNDYAGGTDLSAQACHDHVFFGRHRDGVLENEFSGNLVEVCPTGVFTDKPLVKSYTRKWDLQSAPSICNGCAVGCNTIPGERYGKLKRIHNRYNHEVNGYFICDRGRFGAGYVNSARRLDFAGKRNGDGTFTAVHHDRALELAGDLTIGRRVVAVGSPRASLEANWLLRELVEPENFCTGVADREAEVNSHILEALGNTGVATPSVRDMESADAILILGEDVTNTAPRIALALRQAVRNAALALADSAGFAHWQDAAVRNLAQDSRAPLIIVSPVDTRLDDVASEIVSLAPEEIAGFAHRIAALITSGNDEDSPAGRVAKALAGAKKPLVISGFSQLRTDIVDSARTVAEALNSEGRKAMLAYTMAEANSLGITLLGGESFHSLLERRGDIDTLLVLENDLSRRLSTEEFDALTRNIDVIALDVIENATLDNCDLALPVASFAESEGTLVSSEGRAQRYFPVFPPRAERCPAWQWILELGRLAGHDIGALEHFDQIVEKMASAVPALAKMVEAAPGHDYRRRGLKIPRQTHRYSGRTAMVANVSIHEPRQPADVESPLAFSMEGTINGQPPSAMPYFWSPGWNSGQSIVRFQQEVGGPLRGGPAGVRLIEPGQHKFPELQQSEPGRQAVAESGGRWQLVPVYRLHGSDELSSRTDEIAELAGPGFLAIAPSLAGDLAVEEGDGLIVGNGSDWCSLEVRIAGRIADGCVGYSAGFAETMQLRPGVRVDLEKDTGWQRRTPKMIATDRRSAGDKKNGAAP